MDNYEVKFQSISLTDSGWHDGPGEETVEVAEIEFALSADAEDDARYPKLSGSISYEVQVPSSVGPRKAERILEDALKEISEALGHWREDARATR